MVGLGTLAAGFLSEHFGAPLTLHHVTQALGAGYAYSDAANQIAAIVKLTRFARLAPVLALVAVVLPGERGARRVPKRLWFVMGLCPSCWKRASGRCW